MKNVNHPNRSVLRNNLAIVKTMVECWKECLSIPTEYVLHVDLLTLPVLYLHCIVVKLYLL